MSGVGVFLLLGGTSYAAIKIPAKSIGEKQLQRDAVTSVSVRDGSITASDLAPGAAVSGPRGPRGAGGPPGPAGASAALPPAEAWQPLPYVGGWGDYAPSAWEGGSFRRNQLGEIELRGLIGVASGGPTSGSTIALLPAGYRPRRSQLFSVLTNGDGAYLVGRVDVRPDGQVVWQYGQGGEVDLTTLAGIVFTVD